MSAAKKHGPYPVIPGTNADRTGAGHILRRAGVMIRKRWVGVEAEVLAIVSGLRTYSLNDDGSRVLYGLTPEELQQLSAALQLAMDRWISSGREPAHSFWWAPFDAEAAHLGTAQSVANLTQLSPSYAAARTLQQIMSSEPYRNRVAFAQFKSYEHWTGLSRTLKSELAAIIGQAVADGKGPKAVRAEIAERLEVSKAKALAYAQSDITDTLRQARWAEADAAEAEFGLRMGLLWTSALIPTTRQTHASRHGKVFTSKEVRAFYSANGNKYGCRCAQVETLIDEDGHPIVSTTVEDRLAVARETWLEQNATQAT